MLDLDKLEPKPTKVKMGGKTIEVYPAKVRKTIEIAKFRRDLASMNGIEALEKAIEILTPLVPALSDPTIDFNTDQIIALMNYVEGGEPETQKGKKKDN
jgi:hypothetical protein